MSSRRRPKLVDAPVRHIVGDEPRRHDCHYVDLTAAIATHIEATDFARMREEESPDGFTWLW